MDERSSRGPMMKSVVVVTLVVRLGARVGWQAQPKQHSAAPAAAQQCGGGEIPRPPCQEALHQILVVVVVPEAAESALPAHQMTILVVVVVVVVVVVPEAAESALPVHQMTVS